MPGPPPATKKRRAASAPAPPAPDEAFPRGGAQPLTPAERRQVVEDARAAVDREELEGGGSGPVKKKAKGRGRAGGDDEDVEGSFLASSAMAGKVPKFVELLKYKKLVVGMRLWGIVLEVTPRGLGISLPHGLRGHVAPQEACDHLAHLHKKHAGAEGGAPAGQLLPGLFHVGQFVRCTVVGLRQEEGGKEGAGGGSKVVDLSLRLRRAMAGVDRAALAPGAALPAEVKAELDHGWTLGLGMKGVEGFLPRASHAAAFGEAASLTPGTLLEAVVAKPPDARGVVAVTTDPSAVAGAVTREWAGLSLECLVPGALVNARVRRVQGDGLLVTFLTFFHATIDPFHLHLPGRKASGAEAGTTKGFTEGMKVKARILYVNPASKEVGLSLLPHLVDMTLPSPIPMLGQVFESARVLRVDPGLGLMLALPMGQGEGDAQVCKGYCHVSNVSDERVAKLEASFKAGAALRCRVIGFRLVDGMATLTARKSVVDQQVLSYSDVAPGMQLRGTLTSVDEPGGLLVQVAPHVRALVPRLHLPDAGVAGAKGGRTKKFKVGQAVAGRVLTVDAGARRMTLTLKPGLLTSKLPLIAAPQHAVPGAKAHGVVTGVKDYGVFVSFYGGVAGLAPLAELGLPEGGAPPAYFSPGQVVRARVAAVDPAGRLKLSLKAGKAAAAGAAAAAAAGGEGAAEGANGHGDALGGLQVGAVVGTATVRAVVEAGAKAGGDGAGGGGAGAAEGCGYLLLDIPSAPGVTARLDLRGHLSDHPAGEAALRPLLARKGATLGPLVVLERHEPNTSSAAGRAAGGRGTLIVSRKPSLVRAAQAGQLPRTFEEVKEGAVLHGFAANVTQDAVFVRFAGHVTGRAGLSQLADSFVTDPRHLYTEGQSLRALVTTIDAEHSRFNVTLRPSLTASNDASYLAGLFSDRELAATLAGATEGGCTAEHWAQLRVGGGAQCTVSDHAVYGTVVDLDLHEDLVGVVKHSHLPGAPSPADLLAASTAGRAPPAPPAPPPIGTRLACRVLDVSRSEGIVDLSARADLTAPLQEGASGGGGAAKPKKGGKKAKGGGGAAAAAVEQPAPGTVAEGVVELVHEGPEHYAVVCLAGLAGAPLAAVALTDFNAAAPGATRCGELREGARVTVTVAEAAGPATGGRLLATLPLFGARGGDAGAGGAAGAKQSVKPGSVVLVRVVGLSDAQADVVVGKKLAGRIHVSQMRDAVVPEGAQGQGGQGQGGAGGAAAGAGAEGGGRKRRRGAEAGQAAQQAAQQQEAGEEVHLWRGNPLEHLAVGQVVEAVVLGRGGAGHHGVLELCMRPSVVEAAKKGQPLPPQPTLCSLKPGARVGCVVSEVADDHAWLSVGPGLRGRLHVLDSGTHPTQLQSFADRFRVGDGVAARVAAAGGGGGGSKQQQLDFSVHAPPPPHPQQAQAGVACVASAAIAAAASAPDAAARLRTLLPPRALVMGRVSRVAGGLRVALGGRLHGSVALSDVHDVWVASALEGLEEGSFVRGCVLAPPSAAPQGGGAGGSSTALPRVCLSLRASDGGALPERAAAVGAAAAAAGAPPAPALLPGTALAGQAAAVAGYVKRVAPGRGVFVTLDRAHDARVKMCNLSDGFIEDPEAAFPEGLRVEGRLLAAGGSSKAGASTSPSGQLEMTLRSASTSRAATGLRVLSEFTEGEVVAGRVRRVEKFGVFVELQGSSAVGLAHISELLDEGKVNNIHGLFRQDQAVRAKVLSIDLGAGRMSLSLKPSAVGADEDGGPARSKRQRRGPVDLDDEMADAEEEEGEEDEEDALVASSSGSGSEDEDEGMEEGGTSSEGSEEGSDAGEDDDAGVDDLGASDSSGEGEGGSEERASEDGLESSGDEEEERAAARRSTGAASQSWLALDAGADEGAAWGGGLQLDEGPAGKGEPGAPEGGEAPKAKASRGAKKRAREEREAAIERAEQARLQGGGPPSSAAEFEARVRASPSSSYVWLRYMAFLLDAGEVDKARSVAQRALDTIHYREEGEKFNVWVGLLNLEAAYGSPSPDDALMAAFAKAAQYCDQKRLYFALLGILRRPSPSPGRPELLRTTLRTMTKKFSGSAKVWLAAHEAALAEGASDEGGGSGEAGVRARGVLDRAVAALPRRKHVKVITAAAMHEFSCAGGSMERGRGVLEGLLRNYPKRTDLWSLYLDQEIKAGDAERTRALFERVTALPLPPRKMKFIFKRWLEWEKRGGDGQRVEHVKQKAMEFVERSSVPA